MRKRKSAWSVRNDGVGGGQQTYSKNLFCHVARREHIIRHYPKQVEITRMTRPIAFTSLALLFGGAALQAQQPAAAPTAHAATQTEADEYTRYELLTPETASPAAPSGTQTSRFKIFYEVTATTPGAKVYFNPIRKGSAASDEAVYDAMTGEPLRFEVVSGAEAVKDPLMSAAYPSGSYIRVQLARPVPP
jgi:hypothetical protein